MKKWGLCCIGLLFLAGCGLKDDAASPADEIPKGGKGCYPYEDKMDYVPMEISDVTWENGHVIYYQEEELDETITDLYRVVYRNYETKGSDIDCYIDYEKKYQPVLSGVMDAKIKEAIFKQIDTYLGEHGEEFLRSLACGGDDYHKYVSCMLLRNDEEQELAGIAVQGSLGFAGVDILVSEDFDQLEMPEVTERIQSIRELAQSEGASKIEEVPAGVSFVYQTRTHIEQDVDEGRYIYYVYFPYDGLEYLVQLRSNYTVHGTNKNLEGVGQWKPERIREKFFDFLTEMMKEMKET